MNDQTGEPGSARAESALCDQVMGDRRHGFEPSALERDVRTDEGAAVSEDFDKDYWERRYGGHGGDGTPHVERHGEGHGGHSGSPSTRVSPQLAAEAADLEPGTVLDAGCGAGGDALWLAAHGWRVRAVDLSDTALARGRERAAALGPETADRIDWQQADLTRWTPPEEEFDLVTSQYVHTTGSLRDLLLGLAGAVAPGGTLLFVGHHPADGHSTGTHGLDPHVHFTAAEAAAELDPERWEVLVAEDRTRTATLPGGHEIAIEDAVVRARRRR